eukprot:tig00000430_g623.t1
MPYQETIKLTGHAGYKGEKFYRKLFVDGPAAKRPPIGYNDPAWREDLAGAVARTVAFVAEETGALEGFPGLFALLHSDSRHKRRRDQLQLQEQAAGAGMSELVKVVSGGSELKGGASSPLSLEASPSAPSVAPLVIAADSKIVQKARPKKPKGPAAGQLQPNYPKGETIDSSSSRKRPRRANVDAFSAPGGGSGSEEGSAAAPVEASSSRFGRAHAVDTGGQAAASEGQGSESALDTPFSKPSELLLFLATRWRVLVTPVNRELVAEAWNIIMHMKSKKLQPYASRSGPSRPYHVERMSRGRDGDTFVIAFTLEGEKVVSPPLPSAEDALRFRDRCRIAWLGPKGPLAGAKAPGDKLMYPLEGYQGEEFYRKLLVGEPRATRARIGYNDPARRRDVAGAVARTVAFVAEETGALEGFPGLLALLHSESRSRHKRRRDQLHEQAAGAGGSEGLAVDGGARSSREGLAVDGGASLQASTSPPMSGSPRRPQLHPDPEAATGVHVQPPPLQSRDWYRQLCEKQVLWTSPLNYFGKATSVPAAVESGRGGHDASDPEALRQPALVRKRSGDPGPGQPPIAIEEEDGATDAEGSETQEETGGKANSKRTAKKRRSKWPWKGVSRVWKSKLGILKSGLRQPVAYKSSGFLWRGRRFGCAQFYRPKDAAQHQDRCILAAQWLDRRDGRAGGPTDADLHFDRREYEGDPLFARLEEGALDGFDPADHEALADALKTLIKDTPTWIQPAAAAAAAAAGQMQAPDASAPAPAPAGLEREEIGGEPDPDPDIDSSALLALHLQLPEFLGTRWKELVTSPVDAELFERVWTAATRKRVGAAAPCVYEIVGGRARGASSSSSDGAPKHAYLAAFFLEDRRVISPLLPSVEAALRFRDRCRIAWSALPRPAPSV